MNQEKVLVLIPSRFDSKRFPGKSLAPILGRPMIQWVYEHCLATGFETYVVTDDEKIESCVNAFQGEVCRVDDELRSGTERIYLAYKRFFSHKKYDYIVNVQGDEPLLRPPALKSLIARQKQLKTPLATLVAPVKGLGEDFFNPNNVKVVFSPSGHCHYFSRAPIPYAAGEEISFEQQTWFHHVGVYSYTPAALKTFCQKGPGPLEKIENLEQLRALDLGLSIGACLSNEKYLGVDTPADIARVEGALND